MVGPKYGLKCSSNLLKLIWPVWDGSKSLICLHHTECFLWFNTWSLLFCQWLVILSFSLIPFQQMISKTHQIAGHQQLCSMAMSLGVQPQPGAFQWDQQDLSSISLILLMYSMLIFCPCLLIRILCSVQLVVSYRKLSVLYNTINFYQSKM